MAAMIASTVYDNTATYTLPDTVVGSDGVTYRCLGTNISGDNPVGSATGNWTRLTAGGPPIGTIVPWLGGYFDGNSNSNFQNVIGNDAATINALVNPDGWNVCDGQAFNDNESTIFFAASRYLPNLTDGRFICGDSSNAGDPGSASSTTHTHTTNGHSLSVSEMPSHNHDIQLYSSSGAMPAPRAEVVTLGNTLVVTNSANIQNTGGGGSHSHGSTNNNTAIATVKPAFLGTWFLMRTI